MKFAILFKEKNHYSFLNEIMKQMPDMSSVDLYTDENYSRFSYENLEIHKKRYSLWKLILKRKTYDKIIIDEIFDKELFLLCGLYFSRQDVFLIIHNSRSWFQPALPNRIRDVMVSLYRQFLLLFFDKFIVVSSEIKNWCYESAKTKNFYFIPFGFEADPPFSGFNLKGPLKIAVPGMISERKSYEKIISLIFDEEIRHNFKFVFLGRAIDDYGRKIIERIRTERNVKTFNEFIPEDVYKKEIDSCDLILSDFDTRFVTMFGQEEIYGKTKATGITFLMLIHEKPGILPLDFLGMKEMDSQTLRFSNLEELKKNLLSLQNDRNQLQILSQEARKNRKLVKSQIDELW